MFRLINKCSNFFSLIFSFNIVIAHRNDALLSNTEPGVRSSRVTSMLLVPVKKNIVKRRSKRRPPMYSVTCLCG